MVTSNEKTIERRVFTSFYRDGSIEAFTGIILLQLGLPLLFSRAGFGDMESALLTLPIALVLLTIVFLVRKVAVFPRLGRVKFLPERRNKLSKFIMVPIFTLIAGAVLGYVLTQNDSLRNVFMGLLPYSLSPIIIFSAAAYFLNMKRLYVYGAIVSITFPFGKYLDSIINSEATLPITLLVPGFVFLGIAIVIFWGFLRKYQSPKVQ